MLKNQLPPLEPLVAFEAAARLLSFTLAGQELNLTQAAISQRIRTLERRIGVALFTREHRAVHLTTAGREYQHTVSTLLRHLASATTDIRGDTLRPRLNLAADQSMAALWLVPRLAWFQQHQPGFDLRLVASDEEKDCTADDISVCLIHGDGDWPGFQAKLLFAEEVFPVCSPGYARDMGELRSVDELVEHSLLDLEDTHWDWMNWRLWLNRCEVELPTQHRLLQINSYPLLLEAAKSGQGVALGWRHLVDDALTSHELVRPIDISVSTEFGYYLLRRERDREVFEVQAFCEWIEAEFPGQSTN